MIDFALSGLVNADIADVWVSLEYQVTSIDDYLSGGRPWSLDRNRGGFRRMVPQTGTGPATESGFAHGNGDLLLRMSSDLESFGAPTLVVCSADHVFNMDLGPAVDEHIASGRVATVLTSGVFVYDTAVLLDTLRTVRAELAGRQDDIHDGDSGLGDFGEHLLPRLVETGRVGLRPPRSADRLALARPRGLAGARLGGRPRLDALTGLRD